MLETNTQPQPLWLGRKRLPRPSVAILLIFIASNIGLLIDYFFIISPRNKALLYPDSIPFYYHLLFNARRLAIFTLIFLFVERIALENLKEGKISAWRRRWISFFSIDIILFLLDSWDMPKKYWLKSFISNHLYPTELLTFFGPFIFYIFAAHYLEIARPPRKKTPPQRRTLPDILDDL